MDYTPSFYETYNHIFLFIFIMLLVIGFIHLLNPIIKFIEGKLLNIALGIILFFIGLFHLNEKAKSPNPYIYKNYKAIPVKANKTWNMFGFIVFKEDSTETIIFQVKIK